MKRKLLFVLGIVILVVGIGVFLFPIIMQSYNAHQQRLMMEEVKQEILDSMFEAASNNAVSQDDTAAKTDDNVPKADTGDETSSAGVTDISAAEEPGETEDTSGEVSGLLTLADNLVEEDTVEEESFKSSRLSGQKCVGIITIETINLVYPVVEGVENENIGVAIGHFPSSAAIGAEGNCAMAGHNGGTYGRYFGDIKNLKKDDEIILTNTKGEEFKYYVTESFVVDPTDVYVVEDLGIEGKYLTMVTCTQHGSMRLIVRAKCTEEASKMKGLK